MAQFDTPSINVLTKTNEENLQVTKSYLTTLAEELNYSISQLESRISSMEEMIEKMEKGEE